MASQEQEMVSVPRDLLVRLVEDAEEAKAILNGGKSTEATVAVPNNGYWSRDMVHRLKLEAKQLGYDGALAAGDIAAKYAGTTVSLEKVAMDGHIAKDRIGPDLGAMSKLSRRLFKGAKVWPFVPISKGTGTYYLMQPDIAVWWLEV